MESSQFNRVTVKRDKLLYFQGFVKALICIFCLWYLIHCKQVLARSEKKSNVKNNRFNGLPIIFIIVNIFFESNSWSRRIDLKSFVLVWPDNLMYVRGCCRFSGGLGGPEGPWEGTQNHKNEVTKSKRLFHFTEKKHIFLMSTFFLESSVLVWPNKHCCKHCCRFSEGRGGPEGPWEGLAQSQIWHKHF